MSMILAKVIGSPTLKQTIKVWAPSLKYDAFLRAHFRENAEYLAHDPQERCKSGDWVLIRELPEPLTLKVKHEVTRIVYESGNMICPLTRKKAIGIEFKDDVEKAAEEFGMEPLQKRDFTKYGDIGNRIKPNEKNS